MNKKCEQKTYLNVNVNFIERNSNEKWNNNKCSCECKKRHICEKEYVWNPATFSCKNGKYLASIIDDSVTMCGEIIDAEAKSNVEEAKTVATNFNEKHKENHCL